MRRALDGLRAFVRLTGREMTSQAAKLSGHSQNFSISEAIDRVVIDHTGRLHVGINDR